MKIADILTTVDGMFISENKSNFKINKIKIDSREINKKDLFIAIIGNKYDGHSFIDSAVKKGAAAVIVSQDLNKNYPIPIIKVNDTIAALEKIVKYKRDNFKGVALAITGSVGKTTTKEMLYSVIKQERKVLCNEGNKNNLLGLSLTLLNLKKEKILITELGMNHEGEIRRLSNICKPDISLITNIGTSHIGNLKNKRNIYKAKLEIIEGMNNGKLIVNGDDKFLKKIKKSKNFTLFKCGINKRNDFYCFNIKTEINKSEFDIMIDNHSHHFILNIPGKHLINNALIVIKTALILGINIDNIKKGLANYKTYDGRFKIYENLNGTLIDDSYNSSYESLSASLKALNNDDKQLLIIGDILELGKKSKKIHKKISKLLKKRKGIILLVGNETAILSKKYKHFYNNKELIKYLDSMEIKDYKIFVKGSHAMKLKEICDYFKYRLEIK